MNIREAGEEDLYRLLKLYTQLHENPMPRMDQQLLQLWNSMVQDEKMCIRDRAYAGFGHTLPASVLSTVFTALRIPAALVLSATALGLSGIWWSISISSICKGLILTIMFVAFLNKMAPRRKM